MRKLSHFVLIFITIALILGGCFMEFDPAGSGERVNVGEFDGVVDGVGRGYQSDIRVTLTFVLGVITDVQIASITGSETDGIGTTVMQQAPALIIGRQSMDILDAFAGATRTA